MQRILALDVGDVRVGLAVSDPLGITAQGLETYTRTGDVDKDCNYIINIAKKYAPVKLLFGLPKNMDGSEGFQSKKVRDFAEEIIKRYACEHVFYDERLTTVSAKRIMNERMMKAKNNKAAIDRIAAAVILQSYLDSII